MSIDNIVGTNIRKFRKANHLTLQDLADEVHKSVSTISKYEKGTISLDIASLAEIAEILHVAPVQLMAGTSASPQNSYSGELMDTLYMYTYDRETNGITNSVIERYFSDTDRTQFRAAMFNDVSDIRKPETCNTLYIGTGSKYGVIEHYNFQNQSFQSEHVMIHALPNLIKKRTNIAMVSGLSNTTLLPVSFKAILSESPISNDKELIEILKFSKEELQKIRRDHVLTIRN